MAAASRVMAGPKRRGQRWTTRRRLSRNPPWLRRHQRVYNASPLIAVRDFASDRAHHTALPQQMQNTFEPIHVPGPPPAAEPTAGAGARVFAFIGALLFLVVGGLLSLGTVLLAPVGMAIAGALQRRRGRELGGAGRWGAASAAVALVFLGWIALGASLAPPGMLDQIKHT